MGNQIKVDDIHKESRRELLNDFVDFGILFIAPDGKIVTCNKRFEEITGSSLDELEGTTGEQLFLEQQEVTKFYNRLNDRKKGLSERYRLQIKRKDHSIIWISVCAKPKFNELDQFIGTVSVVEDITDHIQFDLVQEIIDELSKNAHQYEYDLKSFLQSVHQHIKKIMPADNMVFALERTNRTVWFPYVSDSSEEVHRSEFRTGGSGLTEYVMKKGSSVVLNEKALLDLRLTNDLTTYHPIPKSQIVVPIKGGERVIGALRCYSYTHENLYSDTSMLLLERIGERIGILIEKIKNNTEQRMFVELSDIPVVIINRDGFFEFVNQTFADKLQFDICEILHQPVSAFIHVDDHEKFNWVQSSLKDGKSLNDLEMRLVNKKKEILWISWFAQPQLTDVSFYFVGRDITKQKQETKIKERLSSRINNLVLNLKDGVVFVDRKGIITHVNNAICEMLGYTEQELVGAKALDTLYPAEKDRDFDEIFKKDGTPLADRYNIQVEKKNGVYLWINLSLTPEYDENDSLLGVMAILTDISKEQEEKSRKERLYRLHKSFFTLNKAISRGYNLEQIHQTVMSILHTTYRINVSRIYKVNYTEDDYPTLTLAAERMMTKSLNKLSNLFPNGIRDLTPKPSAGSPYLQAIEEQTPLFINGKQTIYSAFSSLMQDPSVELYVKIMNFMKIDFYALFSIVHFNEAHYLIECVSEKLLDEGEMDDLSAFMQQVNALIDKKLGDIDLQKNERKWRGLIENSSEITCIINRTGRITFISPSVERMLGHSHRTILHDNIFSYIHPEDRIVAEERFARRLSEGGEGYYQILRIRDAADNYKFFRVFTSNHLDKEEIEGLIVNAQDITDMIKTENEKYLSIIETEENERKRISRDLHDGVGQYLAATNMYMNLLETTVKDKLDESTQILFHKTAEILRKATTEVRSVSHNIMPPSLKDFGFVDCVKGLVEGLSQGSAGINFTFTESSGEIDLPEWVGLTLFRAIQQILSNAITHGKPKNIALSMGRDKKVLFIQVSDDGVGFDPTRIDEKDGIGIMSIRHRIQSVGGQTIIKSEPGKGTTFTILISSNTIK